MAVILCIVVILVINSVKTEQLETVSKDVTKILEKVIEQIETARRQRENQDNLIGTITKPPKTFYKEGKSDPNDLNDMAKNVPEPIYENESKSSMLPSTLDHNSDILKIKKSDNTQSLATPENESESPIFPRSLDNLGISKNANSNNVPSSESMLKTDDSTFKQQALQEVQDKPSDDSEILSIASRRRANVDTNDSTAKDSENIFNEITYVNRNANQSTNPDISRMQATNHYYSPFTTTTESSIKNLYENFDKIFKTIKEIKQLQQFKLDITEPQYSASMQRVVKMASNPFFQTSQIIPQVVDPFIIRRTPWLQQPHPKNLFFKPLSFARRLRSYPHYFK